MHGPITDRGELKAPATSNPLFQTVERDRWAGSQSRHFETALTHVDHVFHNQEQEPSLLQGGILMCDDVRDLRHADDRLLIATRVGVWEYDLARIQSLIDAIEVWAEKELRPVAKKFDHADEYPVEIVEQMKELGLFGATISQEYY